MYFLGFWSPIGCQFGFQNRAWELPGGKRSIFKNVRFSAGKATVFEVGGVPGRPKSNSESPSESCSFFNGFWDRKVTQNGTEMAPGRHPNRCQNRLFFWCRNSEPVLEPKRATVAPQPGWAEPWGGRF